MVVLANESENQSHTDRGLMRDVAIRPLPLLLLLALTGCASPDEPTIPEPGLGNDLSGFPLRGVSSTLREQFDRGDALFERTQRDADGLGPLYVRAACVDCHRDDVRGPGLVEKISITEADGVTAAADQSKLIYGHSVRPYVTAGASTPVISPLDIPGVKTSRRLGPPVVGRGYMEAVLDSEIERLESEQAARGDEIHGRIHRVTYSSEKNPDSEHLAAQHFQYRWIADHQCYTCHSDYGLFGDVEAKLAGLRHVWFYTLGGYEVPLKIRGTYDNQRCLFCHGPVKSYQEIAEHEKNAAAIAASATSCIGGACHVGPHPKAAARGESGDAS